MVDSATIIAASLDSSQLEQSINKLVATVAAKTKEMADNFTGEIKRMEDAVKNLGNIKTDSGGTADGGSSRRTSKQKEEETQVKETTQAYKEQKSVIGELAMSFDNLNTAITKSNSKLAAKFDVTEQQKVQQLEAQRTSIEDKIVARQIEIDESYRSQLATLSKTRSELESKANLTSKEQADLKHVTTEWERINKIVRDISSRPIVAADDTTGNLGRLQQQLIETNKQLDESRKRIQEMNFERAKMYDGSLSGLVQNAQATMKYQNDTLKKSFEDLLKKPTHDIDEMRAKMERLQTFLNNIKPLNIFSPELIANGERAINKLKNEIQKFNDKPTKQAFTDALKLPDRTQSEIITKINKIRDAIKGVEGTKIISEAEIAKANSLIDSLRDKWSKLYNAPRDRQLRIDFADALKMPTNNIDEIAAKLMRLQHILQEMRGMEVLSPQQIANGNQQISALLSKLEAEMSLRQQINAVEQADMQNTQRRIELEAKYGEEVARAAKIANDWLQKNKEATILNKEGTFVIQDPKAGQTVGQSIEAQLLAYKAINGELNLELEVQKAIANTVNSIAQAEQRRQAQAQAQSTANKSFADYEDLRTAIAAVLRVRESEVSLANSEDASYKALSLTLKQLKQAYESLNASQRKSENADALIASIHETQRAMQEIQNQMSRPVNLANVLALPEKTIDDISYKVQMLRAYAQGINIETNAGNEELRRVMTTVENLNDGLKNAQKTTKQITIESNNIKFDNIAKMPADGLKQVGEKIKEVKQYINELKNQPIVDEKNLKRAEALYDRLIKQSQKLNDTKGTHSNVNDALNVRVKTLDDIAKKMQRLQAIRQNLDINKQKADIDRINAALGELKKQQDEVLQRNANMIKSNNALGRSWNYMKNRLAFYFTVGASTQFIKNLIEVRSQYEMNERALGILINSAERGTQIFNELSQMALVSPYTLIELSAAAKQLTAYDIAARDVVDTTRRLADMASAVGVPIERLTYALGQIKAYGYLNSRDARMFANAGIPLVKQLSDYYTELEGKMVSTADVYDRMKKKAIDYNSVMSVITKMTDEGGKFFDFQAKMADTLKVRLANLTLAWNNMLNDMGKESQGVLTWGIGALRQLFLHWKQLDSLIKDAAWILGIRTGFMLIAYAALKAGGALGITTRQMALSSVVGTKLAGVLGTLGRSIATIVKSPLTWWSLLALAAWDIFDAFMNADKATIEFNNSLRDSAKTTYEDLKKFAEQYKNVRDSLYTTQKTAIGNIYDPSTGKAAATAYANQTVGQDISASEAKKVWEVMREQIELSSHASDEYISKLLSIENISERLRQGFQILDDIQTVSAALKDIGDDGIKVTQGWSAWWNAWQGADGLIQNLKDLQKELQRLKDTGSDPDDKFVKVIDKDYHTALERFRKDLKVTTDSVLDFINLNGWSGDTGKIDEVFKQVTDRLATQSNLDPQTAFTLQKDVEIARAKAAKEALEIRIADEKKALATASDEISRQQIQKNLETLEQQKRDFDKFNGENRAYWNDFTKYIKERHISELTAAYNSMTDHGKKAMDFQSEEWQKHVHDWANRYEKSHNLATDSVFNRLKNWINDANTWSVFIKMTISTEDGKSVYKQLEEYDKAADDAWKTMQRLDKRISQLRKKGAKEVEGAETSAIDLSKVSADDKELTEAIKERTQAQKDYNEAVEKGGESKKENAAASKARKQAESELQKALKEELSIIDKIRSNYQALTKEGMSHADAIKASTAGYEKSAKSINQTLTKFGLQAFDPSAFAGISDPNDLVRILEDQLNKLIRSGKAKPAEIKDLEVKINDVKLDAEKYNLTRITKGLNNELDKLKDEYELAVELDANPELGDMFADMFGIDTNTLPQTFGEALDRAQEIINRKLADLNIASPFDIMQTDVNEFANSSGLEKESEAIKELAKWQNTFRDMFKKNLLDSEKMLDDYVKKYGGYSDKIAEIEADRLEKIKKLNDAYYTEEMRQRPEYLAKMNAIDEGAKQEKSNVEFDAFKNSRYYTMMFENLDYVSTKTIRDMRDRLRELMDSMNDLTPEQLKQVMTQYEKLEQKLVKRSPFKTLTKDLKNYLKTSGDRKAANEAFRNAQKEYDAQEKNVAALKEKYEQAKANNNTSQSYLDFLQIEINAQSDILDIFKKQLELAEKKADEYNLMAKLAKSEVLQVAQVVADNLKGLAELRDQMNELFGVDESKGETLLGHKIDGMIDGLAKASDGISKITSSATSGNIFGVVGGAVDIFTGIGDSIASIFGDGSARTKRLNREINESKETVRQLSMAYDDLERAINKSLGTGETEARRLAIANKEAQLAELERQEKLEQSKRSKDRDDDTIKQYEESIHSLRNEINDLKEEVINNLLGDDVKSAAEAFVDAWVQAWRAGETTLDAIQEKMDEMIYNLIKKAMTSKIVETLLSPIYEELDRMTKEGSEGGVALTTNELRQLAQQAGVTAGEINTALGEFYGNLANLGIISPTEESKELSALQQGIQGITEDTAGALEAITNGISQQCYLQSDILIQIRDTVQSFDIDIQTASLSQILLQLQSSYQLQQSMLLTMENWTNPSGNAVRVELIS